MASASLMKEGQILLEKQEYNIAKDMFKKAIKVLGKERNRNELNRIQTLCEAFNNIGFIYYKKVEFTKALKYYDKSIKLNPSYGTAYYNKGTIHYRLGAYETALKDLEKAVLLEPENLEFKIGLEDCKYVITLASINS